MQKHVLIVDDFATVRKSLLRSNRGAGLAHAHVRDAVDDAVRARAFETATFDLILAEVTTPNAGTPAIAGPLRK